MAPAASRKSKSTGTSSSLSGRQPPEGPPIWAALNFLPLGIPPPTSKMTSRSVVPMGTSTRPVPTTLPARAKTAVPLLFAVPMEAKLSAPSAKASAAAA